MKRYSAIYEENNGRKESKECGTEKEAREFLHSFPPDEEKGSSYMIYDNEVKTVIYSESPEEG